MNGIIEYKEEAPGLIRIKPSIEGLLTIDRYIQIAKDLLDNGISEEKNRNLKDNNSTDLTDSILLKRELKDEESPSSTVKTVVFSMYGTDYILNSGNIKKFTEKQEKPPRKPGENTEAIIESIQEMLSK